MTGVNDQDLVVVGSSAGGIEALSILVSTLPADFPAPLVLAQHLDPNHPSHLDAILQRRTSLRVVVVGESIEMEPGRIYVVPSNRHVIIIDGHVALREASGDGHPQPSVDLLLSTAAALYGEHLIAVILTGSGSDGAAGAIEVKQAGGTVIVQNPLTARYPSMPLALPPSAVDFESDIENIGALLTNLLKGAVLPPVAGSFDKLDDDDALHHILDIIGQHTTLDFHAYKQATVLRRISRRMAVAQIQTLSEYAQFIATHPAESSQLVNAFLINVTRFFRDPEAFTALKDEVLPVLIALQRSQGRTLRFWSAGCATGEEPYSLAMLLTDLLGAELPDWDIKIFGTDVDEAAISFARRGLYAESSLQGMPSDYVARFFDRSEQGYQIIKAVRQMVTFGQHDLSQNGPFPHLDLVICRNVLIYFSTELQDHILNAFTFSLYPNGYLFLGKAETVRANLADYELINKPWKIYHCIRREPPAVGATSFSNRSRNRSNRRLNSKGDGQFLTDDGRSSLAEVGHVRHFNESLLRFLPMAVVVVDRSYHVLTVNLAARRLLGIHEAGDGQDFLHAARGIPYEEVRTAIDSAFRDRKPITVTEIELGTQNASSGSFIALTVTPMELDAGAPDVAAISVSDITLQVQLRRQLETVQTDHARLLEERSAANQHLSEINQKLLEVNERLQVSNDDLILSKEELQSLIEEFETTNEELQASNEEMETTNEELQASNEELQTTNDEVRARALELQELTQALTDERVRLVEMVGLAPFYILVLRGPDLRVQAVNPQFAQLLPTSQIQGQPLSEMTQLFDTTERPLAVLAQHVYQHDAPLTTGRLLTHLQNAAGENVDRYFVFTLKPSHAAAGAVDGVVIYAEDVTEQRQRAIDQERERLRLIFDQNEQAVFALYDAQTTRLVVASARYLEEIEQLAAQRDAGTLDHTWHEISIFITREQRLEHWQIALTTRQRVHLSEVHYKFSHDQQDTIWDWTLTPVIDTEEPFNVRFMLVAAIAITEQVRIRQELERLDRLKDEFLAIASHELRGPLSLILGYAQLIQQDILARESVVTHGALPKDDRTDREIQLLKVIIEQVHHLNTMVKDMLDVTRIQTGQFDLRKDKPVDLVALIRRVVEPQQLIITTHTLTLEVPPIALLGYFDEERLVQVINNLIGNAVKYSPAGAPIYVGAQRRLSETGSAEAVVWVRDKGYGISEDKQASLFDRFYRARTERHAYVPGLGLGLYISREIVTQHGGRIWLESTVNVGSTFYFSLPLKE